MTPESRAAVAAEARSWLGTPFAPHVAAKGVGADCVQLALAVYKACGLVPRDTQFPPYRLDGGEHLASSAVVRWLVKSPLMEQVDRWGAGTVLVLKVGRVEHHVGVAVSDKQFVQSIRNYGVVLSDLSDPTWRDRVMSCWEAAS